MADFGDIQNSIAIGAGQAIRRNAGDTGFEAFSPGGGAFTAGVSTGGNTVGTTGTVNNQIVFAGGNNVTLSQSTAAGGASVTISGANQSNQSLGIYGLGNTSGTSSGTADARSLSFSAGSGITVDMTNNQVNMSVQPPIRVGVSTMGNTAGSTGTVIRSYILVGSNAATLSQSTAAGGAATVTIDVPTQTIQTQNMVSVEGSTGNIDFANANGVTFGFNASTITASHNGLTTAAQSDHSHGNPTLNLTNLSGTTASASNGLTLSLSAAAPGGGVVMSRFDAPIGQLSSSGMTNASASVKYLSIPTGISFSRVDVPILLSLASSATANTGNILISSGLFISTRNGVSLEPVTGSMGTTTYTWASNTANFSNLSGARNASFAINTSLSAGEYWIGFQMSTNNNSSIGTATTQYANTLSVFYNSVHSGSAYNDLGSATNTSVGWMNQGVHTNTVTATNQTLSFQNISKSGTAFVRGNILPIFRNY
jgi:hypothetical protein